MNLKSKKVLITGATGGIGYSLVEKFYNFQSIVIATGTNEEKLTNLKKKFPNIFIEKFKLNEHDKIEEFVERVEKKIDGLDILVNNAGITLDNLSIRLTEENWKKVLDINLTSSFLMCKHVIKKMLRKKYGKIINITSIVGHTGNLGQANYAASKAGLIGLAKSISKELGSRNITSNVVAPGYIETDMTSFLDDENKENIIEQLSIKRIGKPEDISNVVAFLCDDESEYITGQVIPVDGGLTT